MIVIFIGISIFLGSFFPDFRNSEKLIVSITFAAFSFTLFDLFKLLKLPKHMQGVALFSGILLTITIPYIKSFYTILHNQSNRFTLIGLSIVIFIIGLRQHLDEKKDLQELNNNVSEMRAELNAQLLLLEKQNDLINKLNDTSHSTKDNVD